MPLKYRHARSFSRPGRLFEAMILGLFMFVTILSTPVLLGFLIFLDNETAQRNVGIGLLACLVVMVLSRVWLYWLGRRTHCQLCSGHLFHNKGCRPHSKAAKYPGFTYVGSMILDLFLRLSFRCMYCGTSFRIFK
jgi:hypothetical protein